MTTAKKLPQLIGWREWVSLPGLNVPLIKAKIDTGAKTSTLHAVHIETYGSHGKDWVRFRLHPIQRTVKKTCVCDALLLDKRVIKSSTGHRQERHIIQTMLEMGGHQIPIELTLTNRDQMGFRMLLGRDALNHHFHVDPSASYLLGDHRRAHQKKLYA